MGPNLTLNVVIGGTAGLDDISAAPAFHLKNRGIDEVPGKITYQTYPRKPGFHQPSLPRAQPVAVPGLHSRRLPGPGRCPTLDLQGGRY